MTGFDLVTRATFWGWPLYITSARRPAWQPLRSNRLSVTTDSRSNRRLGHIICCPVVTNGFTSRCHEAVTGHVSIGKQQIQGQICSMVTHSRDDYLEILRTAETDTQSQVSDVGDIRRCPCVRRVSCVSQPMDTTM